MLLDHGHSVVTTVRSQDKAEQIKKAFPDVGPERLDFAIVEDIAQPNGQWPRNRRISVAIEPG